MSITAPQKRSIKVPPVLYRQGTSELREDGTIRLSISSDRPYLRYDWWNDEEYYEKLDHADGGVDLTRINAGTALLFNHDRDVQLGKITHPELTGGKCFVAATVSKADDVASYRTRIEEGILKDSSVGYELIDDGEEEGEIDGIPVFRFKWRPFEASLVTIPADITVGVGRERDLEKPKGEPREIRIREKTSQEREINVDDNPNPSQKREKQEIETTPPTTTMSTPTAEAPQKTQAEIDAEKREQKEKIQEGIKAARERETEIRAIAKKSGKVPEKVLEKAIEDAVEAENAVESFRKLVFDKYWGNAEEATETPGAGNGDLKSSDGKRLSIGAEFVRSKDFSEKAPKQGRRGTIAMEFDTPMLGIRGKVAMAQRAGFISSDLAPVNVQIQTGVVGLGMQRLTIMDLIAPGSIGAAALIYPRENSFGTIDGVAVAARSGGVPGMPRAKTVGERGLKPLWEPDLTTETAAVKTVAITTKVPNQFMSDFPAAQSYIDERLPFMVDTETEWQILYGDGLDNNLKGIFSTNGVQTRLVLATDDRTVADSMKKGLTDISVNSFFEPDAYAFHPYDWETASLLKDSQGRYLGGGPFYIPIGAGLYVELYTFWGKPVVVTTAVEYGRPVAGAWKLGAQYFMREGMRLEMTNSNEDDFRRNLIMLRAEHRLLLATYRPACFLEFTGFPART